MLNKTEQNQLPTAPKQMGGTKGSVHVPEETWKETGETVYLVLHKLEHVISQSLDQLHDTGH